MNPNAFRHNGRKIGSLSKDGKTWFTRRVQQGHWCHRYMGYGIQAEVLDALKERGVERITLWEQRPSGKVVKFTIPIGEWGGVRDVLRQQDGLQVFMPYKSMLRFVDVAQ